MKPYNIDDAERDLRAAIDTGEAAEIQRLGTVVDHLDVRPSASLHAAALWYAEHGLHIFPLTPGSKIPLKGSGGFKDATTDADRVDAWWAESPALNIGIATGHLVDVVDVDGPAGVRTWIDLYDDLPHILGRVCTPRPGGNHLYVIAVPGRGNKAGIMPGIDYRGTGGYVVAPPSVITGGDHPGSYSWYSPLDLDEDLDALGMTGVA